MYKVYYNPITANIISSQEYFEYDPSFTNYYCFNLKNCFSFKDFDLYFQEEDGSFIYWLANEDSKVAQLPKMFLLLPENINLSFTQNYDKKWCVSCWVEFNSKEDFVLWSLKNN